MARLYANENFALPTVVELRNLGHDVLTVVETGKAEQAWPDEDVLEYATQDDRAIINFNRKHFIRLYETKPGHAGIIVCTYDPNFLALARQIHVAISPQSTLLGQLVRVNREN